MGVRRALVLDAYCGQCEFERGVASGVPFAPGGGNAASIPDRPDKRALLDGAVRVSTCSWSYGR